MHDTHGRYAGHDGIVQVAVQLFERLFHAPSAYIKLHGNFGLILVARQHDGWLAFCLGCGLRCLALTDALNVIYAHAEAHRTHLYFSFAAVRRKSEQFRILAEAEDAHRITDLQWPVEFLLLLLGFFAWTARRRDGGRFFLEAAHSFTCLAQTLAREVDAARVAFYLCQRFLHLFEYTNALFFEFEAILFEFFALMLRLGAFHTEVEALIL